MWSKLNRIYITKGLVVTPPFKEELVRITQLRPIYPDRVSGLMYQAFSDGREINTFDEQKIVYQNQPQTFTFYYPKELGERSLAFTRTDKANIVWGIDIEILQSNNQQSDNQQNQSTLNSLEIAEEITNYLNSQLFNDAMDKFDLIPKSESVQLQPGFTAQPLVPPNPKRAYLQCRAGGSPVYIWAADLNEQGQPQTILEEVEKGQTRSLPIVADGIYKGAVYAQVSKKVNVDWTEYSYP